MQSVMSSIGSRFTLGTRWPFSMVEFDLKASAISGRFKHYAYDNYSFMRIGSCMVKYLFQLANGRETYLVGEFV